MGKVLSNPFEGAIVSGDYRDELHNLMNDPVMLGMAAEIAKHWEVARDQFVHEDGHPNSHCMAATSGEYHDRVKQAGTEDYGHSIGGPALALVCLLDGVTV